MLPANFRPHSGFWKSQRKASTSDTLKLDLPYPHLITVVHFTYFNISSSFLYSLPSSHINSLDMSPHKQSTYSSTSCHFNYKYNEDNITCQVHMGHTPCGQQNGNKNIWNNLFIHLPDPSAHQMVNFRNPTKGKTRSPDNASRYCSGKVIASSSCKQSSRTRAAKIR